jgi:hypothetical protein
MASRVLLKLQWPFLPMLLPNVTPPSHGLVGFLRAFCFNDKSYDGERWVRSKPLRIMAPQDGIDSHPATSAALQGKLSRGTSLDFYLDEHTVALS